MILFFMISQALACNLENFEDCFQREKNSAKCIRESSCVSKELKIHLRQSQVTFKGFEVSPKYKHDIGELIGCDLNSYESCFSLPESKFLNCLRKVDCLEFTQVSELENNFFDYNQYFTAYRQYAEIKDGYTGIQNENLDIQKKDSQKKTTHSTEQPTKDKINNEELLNELQLMIAKVNENHHNEQDGNNSEEDKPDNDNQGIHNTHEKIFQDQQTDDALEAPNHLKQDNFVNELWKIEQGIIKKEKTQKGFVEIQDLDVMTMAEVGAEIQKIYDLWDEAVVATGDQLLQFQWMMDSEGKLKEPDVILEKHYLVFRNKMHEKMESQAKVSPREGNIHEATDGRENKGIGKELNFGYAENQEVVYGIAGKTEISQKGVINAQNEKKIREDDTEIQRLGEERVAHVPQKSIEKEFEDKKLNKEETVQKSKKIEEQDIETQRFDKEGVAHVPKKTIEKEFEAKKLNKEETLQKSKKFTEQDIETQRLDEEGVPLGLNKVTNNEVHQPDMKDKNEVDVKFVAEEKRGNDKGLEQKMNENDDEIFDAKTADMMETKVVAEENSEDVVIDFDRKGFLQNGVDEFEICEKKCENLCLDVEREECYSECVLETCSSTTPRSDLLTVILTALFLFTILLVLFLLFFSKSLKLRLSSKGHTA